jgi:uncharacterized membrane protein YphA (DoxX/SURF4 family)
MFSTFPDGWPGSGLLLLRAGAGVALIVQATRLFDDTQESGWLRVVAGLTAAVGTLLLVGFLTRLAAAAAVVGSGLSWFARSGVGVSEGHMTAALAMVIAAAVVCLGPGAFSLDARLFGRREIILPDQPSDS